MPIALISQGRIQTIIVGSLAFAQEIYPDLLALELAEGEGAGAGWLYDPNAEPRFFPEPAPENPAIDWNQFRSEISAHPAYLRLASATPQNLALNSLITSLLWQVGGQPELLTEVAVKWNLMVSDCPLDSSEVIALNEIAERCGLPLRLGEGGQIQ